MTKPMKKMMIALIIIFGGLLIFNIVRALFMKEMFAHFQPPPMVISTTKAKAENWHPYISAIGTLQAVNGVFVSTEAAGIIAQIFFNSGQLVKKGQPLISLNDSIERATLEDNQASYKLAYLNFRRQQDLLKQRATPQSSVDEAEAKLAQSKAAIDKTIAMIAQKNIVAPFDGKIGIRKINIGQYVSPGTQMVDLQSLNPLYLNFSIPEQNLKSIYPGQTVLLSVDVYPNVWFKGQINAINSSSNISTHNIELQATIPNGDLKLYPGLFANIHLLLPLQENVVTLPQTAISSSLYGDSVFVVKSEEKGRDGKPILRVHRRYVKTGDQRENQIAILDGLQPNEEVATSGQLKLDDGTTVAINNSVDLITPSKNLMH